MKELSLNILDVAKNSVTAGATRIEITVDETPQRITIAIRDNGCGMTPEQVQAIMQSLHQPFKPGQKGTGLRSVFYRLDYFFDGETDFSIESRPGQTRIVITIPYRVNEEKNDNFTEKC